MGTSHEQNNLGDLAGGRVLAGTVSQLSVHNNWGFALQAGAEYKLAKRWQLFADYKRVWLAVDAHGLLAGGVPVNARVKLDPSLVSAGIKFHFYWGVAP